MGAFYGIKINNKEINETTGKPWTIDDVPPYWVAKVEAYLGAE